MAKAGEGGESGKDREGIFQVNVFYVTISLSYYAEPFSIVRPGCSEDITIHCIISFLIAIKTNWTQISCRKRKERIDNEKGAIIQLEVENLIHRTDDK